MKNYMVDLDMYKAFVNQLKKENMYVKEKLNDEENSQEKQIIAKRDNSIICSQKLYLNNSKPAEYYIYKDPHKDDAVPPKKIQKIKLNTPREVQAFIDGLKAAGMLK